MGEESDPAVEARLRWLADEGERMGWHDKALLSRLRQGFTLEATEPAERTTTLCMPHKSFRDYAPQFGDALDDQLRKGWVTAHAFPASLPAKVSPQGSAAKARSEVRRRTSDWSFNVRGHVGQAPNDAVDKTKLPPTPFPSNTTYAQALLVLLAGAGDEKVFQVGVDLTAAYSMIALLESELWLSNFVSPYGVICERRLSFGGRSAPNLFARITALLVAIVNQTADAAELRDPIADSSAASVWEERARGGAETARKFHVSGYLDDFTSAAVGLPRALRVAGVVVATMARCNLALSDKTQGPATTNRHLGLLVSTDPPAIIAPRDKRDYLSQRLTETVFGGDDGTATETITQSDLRSVAHGLHFLTPAYPKLRGRLAAMFRLSHKRTSRGRIANSRRIQHDAERALRYLHDDCAAPLRRAAERSTVNGGMASVLGSTAERFADFSSDAAGHHGGYVAAYNQGTWCRWQPSLHHLNFLSIGALEFLGACAGLIAFKGDLGHAVIRLLNDNQSVVASINGLSPRDPVMQECLAAALDLADDAECILAAVYIRSAMNTAADMLSRGADTSAEAFAARHGHTWREIEYPDEVTRLADRLVEISKAEFDRQGKSFAVHGPPGVLRRAGSVDGQAFAPAALHSAAARGYIPRLDT
jgi:hypothetical protein